MSNYGELFAIIENEVEAAAQDSLWAALSAAIIPPCYGVPQENNSLIGRS